MSKPKTRSEKQAETRAALLRAAYELFPRRGMERTSVDDIAAAAGYTKGAFYSNFSSKEELFLVMLDERFAEHIERLDQTLAGIDDADAEAQRASTDFLTEIHADPDWPRLYFEFVAYAARNEAFREELADRHRELRRRMAEIFSRWATDFPAQPPLPMTDIATMIDFMADGFIVDHMIDPELKHSLYTSMQAIFFRGLQAMAVGWEPEEEGAEAAALP